MVRKLFPKVVQILVVTSALTSVSFGCTYAQADATMTTVPPSVINSGTTLLQTRQISSGTTVKVKLLQAINSGSAQVGDQVRVQVAGDDTSGLPAGTIFIGRLTQVKAATNKSAGAIALQFGIPNQGQPDTQISSAFADAATAHLYGQAPKSEKSNYASIGAGAGALLGLGRKGKLGDAIAGAVLGGVGGYAADQAQKHPGGDVNLLSGAELPIQLKTPLTLRTEIVAPY